jgi:uncharacterized FAD-dependent dehydrogenase
MTIFDVGIIGAGVAGSFATYKISKEYKNVKTIVFDLGRPPMKRRRQLEGWLGCLPNSDGKLYLTDIDKVANLTGLRKAKSSFTYFNNILKNINDYKIIVDKKPQVSVEKKFKKAGYDIQLNDYMQIFPSDIHALSKYMAEFIEKNNNIHFSFDNEIKQIHKQKNYFVITSDNQEFKCKKIIIATGRSGWRWSSQLFNNFRLIENNDTAKYGIRIEINSDLMKEFNKSNCSITRGNDLELGPFSWNGTVIPEDHVDMAISAFRSNENRWKTDKLSFSLIGNRPFPGKGFEQTDRIAKLTFILSNDRIIKEKISNILNGKSRISIIPEYDWLKTEIKNLSTLMPELVSKGHFHVPTIMPLAPKINIGSNLETEVEGMHVVGESAGITGIVSAAISGMACVDFIFN